MWTFTRAENRHPRESAKPAMEGHLQNDMELLHYLGGLCFGHTSPYEQRMAGNINLQLRYDGEPEGMVHVLVYDDEPSHWETVQAVWNSNHCGSPINLASKAHRLKAKTRENYTVIINQQIVSRHWHIVLATCVPTSVDSVDYQVFAQGDLARWGFGTWSPPQCPGEPLQKVKDAVFHLEAIMM